MNLPNQPQQPGGWSPPGPTSVEAEHAARQEHAMAKAFMDRRSQAQDEINTAVAEMLRMDWRLVR